MSANPIELKRCPFCGGRAHWCMCDEEGCHRIECQACRIQIDTLSDAAYSEECDTVAKLRIIMAAAWNRRAPEGVK